LFFKFFPLRDESSELLARTVPDIRDVLIAFFGGLALVIARAKKGTIASVIFGVAIATALMPPLCTVGFGLAIGNWDYAGGAMYLFSINTIFIALATFLIIKVLKFPMVRYVNSQRRRLIGRLASLVAILVMIPAGITFWNALQESLFRKEATIFINENIATYKFNGQGRFLEDFTDIEYNKGENSLVEVVFMGSEIIPSNIIATWKAKMIENPKLKDCQLLVIQGSKNEQVNQLKYVNELYESQKNQLLTKDDKIGYLESELVRLKNSSLGQIPFKEISLEAKANYEHLSYMGYSHMLSTNFEKLDTIPVFEIAWKAATESDEIEKDQQRLEKWLKLRLQDDTIEVRQR